MWLPRLTAAIGKLGLSVTPSVGNFVLIHFPDEAGRRAADADAFLLKRGVVLRRMEAYGLPNALRMTVGSAESNEATVAALGDFLARSKP
jgi:histidinol-phosphate aminotransferase